MEKVICQFKVVPKSAKTEVVKIEDDVIKIKVQGIPEKNEVNDNLVKYLSKRLKIPLARICIIKGLKSTTKWVEFTGILKEEISHRLLNE